MDNTIAEKWLDESIAYFRPRLEGPIAPIKKHWPSPWALVRTLQRPGFLQAMDLPDGFSVDHLAKRIAALESEDPETLAEEIFSAYDKPGPFRLSQTGVLRKRDQFHLNRLNAAYKFLYEQ